MRAAATDPSARGTSHRYHVESLSRGLRLLALFSEQDAWLTQSEIARRMALSPATTLRLLRTLQDADFIEQSPETKRYRPGLAAIRLGFAAVRGLGLRDAAIRFLERLAIELNATANLAILAGTEIVYIERVKHTELVTADVHVGSRLPAYSTSMGKMLIASLASSALSDLLDRITFVRTGPRTITDRGALEKELAEIRRRGYAIQDEELIAGLRSAAAPIRNRLGVVIAAINVAVPSLRVSRMELEAVVVPRVVQTAAEISAALMRSEVPAPSVGEHSPTAPGERGS